jgi:hypothetical protein
MNRENPAMFNDEVLALLGSIDRPLQVSAAG